MTKKDVRKKLGPYYRDGEYTEAFDAFCEEMKCMQYGVEETRDAWGWFLLGWSLKREASERTEKWDI